MTGFPEISTRHRLNQVFLSVADTYENVDLNRGSFNHVSDRVRVALGEVMQGRTTVILIFGRSNGANSGDTPYVPSGRVFNFNLFDANATLPRTRFSALRNVGAISPAEWATYGSSATSSTASCWCRSASVEVASRTGRREDAAGSRSPSSAPATRACGSLTCCGTTAKPMRAMSRTDRAMPLAFWISMRRSDATASMRQSTARRRACATPPARWRAFVPPNDVSSALRYASLPDRILTPSASSIIVATAAI